MTQKGSDTVLLEKFLTSQTHFMQCKYRTVTMYSHLILFLLLTFVIFLGSICAQEEVIRINTNLVSIPTVVLDRDGRYVTDLKKEDFQIFEDGVEQEIALFETNEQPFTALILLDSSGSMEEYSDSAIRAVNVFIRQLRPDDQIIIATFNTSRKINIALEATKKRDLTQALILKTSKPSYRAGSAYTPTFNAVVGAMKYLKRFQGRRAIILYGDGEQYGYKESAKSSLRDAEEQESIIYTIRFGNRSTGKFFENADNYLQTLSQKTGGKAYQATYVTDLEGMFSNIANELGRQYYLGYYPKTPAEIGQKRQIKVRTHKPGLVIRARTDYAASH